MTWNEIFDIFPLAADVCKTYEHFRDTGLARDRAAGEVLAMYSEELSDPDDCLTGVGRIGRGYVYV